MAKAYANTSEIEISDFSFLKALKDEKPCSLRLPLGTSLSCLSIDGDDVFLHSMTRALRGIEAAQGNVSIKGEAVDQKATEGGIASVSSQGPLFGQLNVEQNIFFPLRVATNLTQEDISRRAQGVRALLGLEKIWDFYPHQLNVIDIFRVKLARALIRRPLLIIFDQITCHMDDKQTEEIILLLDRLKRSVSMTYLFLTTNKRSAFMASPRTAVFYDKHVCQVGTTSQLMTQPDNSVVAKFVCGSNVITANVLRIEDDIATLHLPCGCDVEAIASHDLREGVLADLCIAPQQISLLTMPKGMFAEESQDVLSATLIAYFHLGEMMTMRLRLKDGTELVVHRPANLQRKAFSPGESVSIAWPAQNAIAFPL